MIAGGTECRGTTYLHVGAAFCNPNTIATRAARLEAARAYMRALGASVAAGEPMDELHHDHGAFSDGGRQLLDLCAAPGVGAPMVLA